MTGATDASVLGLLLLLSPPPPQHYPQDQFNRCHLCASFRILSSGASAVAADRCSLQPARWSEFTVRGENRWKTLKRYPEVVKAAAPRVELDVGSKRML